MNQELLKVINKMSVGELEVASKAIVDMLKAKRNINGAGIKAQLKVGMEVGIDHPNHKGDRFKVRKINRTRAQLFPVSGDLRGFTVPFNMIIIGENAAPAKKAPAKTPPKKRQVHPSKKSTHLRKYLEEFHNFMRRACDQKEIAIPTDEASAKKVIQLLNSAISPENLSCDGELPRTEINRRTRMILNAVKDLEQILGRTIELEDY